MKSANPVKKKITLLALAHLLGSVTRACQETGFSRDSYYRLKKRYEVAGEPGLAGISRQKPNLKNRLSGFTIAQIIAYSLQHPAHGQIVVSRALRAKGIAVSPAGVRAVWLRHDMPTFQDRLTALAARIVQDGITPTAEQRAALQHAARRSEAHSLPPLRPGSLGMHCTRLIGNLQGIGPLYQQTFIDIYSHVAFARLATTPEAEPAIDLLRRQVLPFFRGFGVPLLQVLTEAPDDTACDADTSYRAYLEQRGITHGRVAVYLRHVGSSPVRQFLDAVKNEFFSRELVERTFDSLTILQQRLDMWLETYNAERSCTSRYCYGKTPIETFIEAAPVP